MGKAGKGLLSVANFRSTIARRVAVVTAAMTLAIVLGLGTLSYWNTRSLIEQQINSQLRDDVHVIADRIQDWLNEIARSASSLSSNMMVVNALVDSPGRDTYIVPFLRSHHLAKQGVIVTLCDFRGIPVASSVQGAPPSYHQNRNLVARVVDRGRVVATVDTSKDGAAFFVALPLIYPATGLPEGMLVLTVDLSERLQWLVHAAPTAHNLSVRLLLRDRAVWEHEHPDPKGAFKTVRRVTLEPPLDRLGFSLEIGQAAAAAFLPLHRITVIYVLFGVGIVLFTVALAVFYGRRIARPLVKLSDAAEKVAETGSPSVRLPVQGTDEIASLSSSFNTMLARLQESAEFLEQRVVDRTRELAVANESLRRSEEFVSNILNTVDEGFLVVDRGYLILAANKTYGEQVGKDPKEILGKPCYEVSHHRKSPCYETGEDCAVKKVFESGLPSASSHVYLDAEGADVHVHTKAFPVRNETGEVVSVIEVLSNVTEQRNLEEQLRQAQKMEAIGVLAGGIAHDFNNILSAIIGYGNLLQMKLGENEPEASYLNEIMAASDRASSLTRSLLAFSRKQVVNRRPEDLRTIIRGFSRLLQRVLREDIEFRIDVGEEDLIIMADSGQIEQVLMNLVTNARDAMPNGGTLTIEAGRTRLDEDFIHAHGFGAPGEYVRLSVQDTGEGMNEKARQRIFEPFFTTKELGKGTGLGLAIVYGAVRQNGGHIEVQSQPDRGARFDLYFPLLTASGADISRQPVLADIRGGHEVLLLAEDEAVLRRLTAQILRAYGYTVIEAENGDEAVRKFNEEKNAVSLAILDVIMPKRSGVDAARELLRERSDLKVLFVSGYSREVMTGKGLFDGSHSVLAKPFTPSALLHRVRDLLDQRLPVAESTGLSHPDSPPGP